MIVVDAYVWRRKGKSVGHAMMTRTCVNDVLLSQFPHAPEGESTPVGKNTRYDFGETYRTEGRAADFIFVIKVPNGQALLAEAARQRQAPLWFVTPQMTEKSAGSHTTTHCAWAVKEALRAGGLPISKDTVASTLTTYLPDILAGAILNRAINRPFGSSWAIIKRNYPWCAVPL
jgi:hypothetical protein